MTLFDAYIVVDWNSSTVPTSERPRKDAIWAGEYGNEPTYWRTRSACVAFLADRLRHHVAAGRRVFIGFDVPYGFPAGFAASLGLDGWRGVWDELARLISDDDQNLNNRFDGAALLNDRIGGGPGPFWGHQASVERPTLKPTSPGFPYAGLERLRWTERGLRGIQEVWKLTNPGAVGGQALTGIPRVAQLHDDPTLRDVSRVWPFETGFTARPAPHRGPFVLHAEIWPSLIPPIYEHRFDIRDRAQVRTLAAWIAGQDAIGALARWFDRPPQLPDSAVETCIAEEGWLLGSGLR